MTSKSDNIQVISQTQNLQEKNGLSDENQDRIAFVSHLEYREKVHKAIEKRIGHFAVLNWLRDNVQRLLTVWELDLSPMQEMLRSFYSAAAVGSKPYDPQTLLRSLMLMSEFSYNSIKKWVSELNSRPLLAVFIGATPDSIPAASTHYDFMMRFENGPHFPKCCHRVRPSEERHARSKAMQNSEKKPDMEPAHDFEDRRGVIRRFVEETCAKEQQPTPKDLTLRLNTMLLELGVKPSVREGFIGDTSNLTVLGDGTAIDSAGSPDGKRLCDCREKGIYRCECKRQYSDTNAQWGWDNRAKNFFYGYRMFQLVSADNRHNLPLHLVLNGAGRHEVMQAVESIDRVRKEWPQAVLSKGSFDALYDMSPFYEYLDHCQMGYAIPYKVKPAPCVVLGKSSILCTEKGEPLCLGGLPMLRHGTDRQGRHVYHCPVKRNTHRDGKHVIVNRVEECPLGCLCDPNSKMGPFIYVSPKEDLRVHPSIPRESQEYEELRNLRSSCERSNSMKKTYYRARELNTRVMNYAFIRLALISVLEHARVRALKKLAPLHKERRLETAADLLRLFS